MIVVPLLLIKLDLATDEGSRFCCFIIWIAMTGTRVVTEICSSSHVGLLTCRSIASSSSSSFWFIEM
jgi:hypothetical protein